MKLKKTLFVTAVITVLLYSCRLVNPLMISLENDLPSVSTGGSADGKLVHGKRLPNKGANFRTVSYFFTSLGRNGVNSRVRNLTVAVYDSLHQLAPEKKFLYGETGWVHGGKFWPHYTHQNGLVVDYMVPVFRKGKSSQLRTHVFNRWGYAYEFDTLGKSGNYTIDFEAMATHLYLLEQLAPKYHLRIRRIIFATEFVPMLLATEKGRLLANKIEFVQKNTWLRHDDHYHTEFEVTE